MYRTTSLLTTLLLSAMMLPAPAAADGGCGQVTTIALGVHIVYIDDRSEGAGDIDHWFYLESNGIDGLQTGGKSGLILDPKSTPFSFYDACFSGEGHTPDTYLI